MTTAYENFGVPSLQIGGPDPINNLASLVAVTAAFSAVSTGTGSATVQKVQKASNRQSLPTASYKCVATLLGFDPMGGYATTASTVVQSSAISYVAGTNAGLLFRIANANWAATGFASAVACALWLVAGSANPQLVDYGLINPALDFSFLVTQMPPSQAPYSTIEALAATTPDPIGLLGSTKTPSAELLGIAYETTGGVTLDHKREGFTASPDHSPNFPQTTNRATDISTKILSPVLPSVAQAVGSDYIEYTDSDTNTTLIEQVNEDIFQAAVSVLGNGSVLLTYPTTTTGRTLRRKFIGQITTNNVDFQEAFRKDAQTELQVSLVSAALDNLVRGCATGLARID
jgi:hypothetical protein